MASRAQAARVMAQTGVDELNDCRVWLGRKSLWEASARIVVEYARGPLEEYQTVETVCGNPLCLFEEHLVALEREADEARPAPIMVQAPKPSPVRSASPVKKPVFEVKQTALDTGDSEAPGAGEVVADTGDRPRLKQCEINAQKQRCPAGHLYDARNTAFERDGNGRECRKCRACMRERKRRQRALRVL